MIVWLMSDYIFKINLESILPETVATIRSGNLAREVGNPQIATNIGNIREVFEDWWVSDWLPVH